MKARSLVAVLALALLSACPKRRAPTESLTLSVPWEMDTLDPHARNWAGAFALLSHFYEPLVDRDANLALRPCLAARWSNPDALTWIFKLTPGVVFRSGRPVEAEDVVASLERLVTNPDLGMAVYASKIASLKALNPDTVEIKTKRPTALLLNDLRFVLIMPKGQPLPRDVGEVDGTGPYRPTAFTKDTVLEMERNEAYHGRRPDFRRVTFHLARGPQVAVEDLLQDRSQLVQCNARRFEEKLHGAPDLEVKRQTSLFVKFLGFDLSRETTPFVPGVPNPFRRREVREAISLALDRTQLAARLSTYAVPAAQLVPPYVFGYSPDTPPPAFDLVRAKKLMAEAGYPNGFAVTLHARRFAETAELVAEMLKPIGIEVSVVLLSDGDFFALQRSRGMSFYLARIGCPTGDADIFLQQVVRSTGQLGLGGIGMAASAELDAAIDRTDELVDMEVRQKAVQAVLDRVQQSYALLALYMDQDVYALRRGLVWQPRIDSYILAAELSR